MLIWLVLCFTGLLGPLDGIAYLMRQLGARITP